MILLMVITPLFILVALPLLLSIINSSYSIILSLTEDTDSDMWFRVSIEED